MATIRAVVSATTKSASHAAASTASSCSRAMATLSGRARVRCLTPLRSDSGTATARRPLARYAAARLVLPVLSAPAGAYVWRPWRPISQFGPGSRWAAPCPARRAPFPRHLRPSCRSRTSASCSLACWAGVVRLLLFSLCRNWATSPALPRGSRLGLHHGQRPISGAATARLSPYLGCRGRAAGCRRCHPGLPRPQPAGCTWLGRCGSAAGLDLAALVPAAMSEMVESSVSRAVAGQPCGWRAWPSRWRQGLAQVPIWLILIRIELAMFFSMPSFRILVLVTDRSSPTTARACQPLCQQLQPSHRLRPCRLRSDDRVTRTPARWSVGGVQLWPSRNRVVDAVMKNSLGAVGRAICSPGV